jgi:hypothetical protein
MRKWILAVGVACTVCGAWLLPPEPWDPFLPRFSRQTPERTEARRIGTEMRHLSEQLKRLRTSEHLARQVGEAADKGSGLLLKLHPDLTSESAEVVTAAARESFESWASQNQEVVVGMIAIEQSFAGEGLWRTEFAPGGEFFVELQGDRPYCVRILPYRSVRTLNEPSSLRSISADFADFGICGYMAKFGVPGPRVWSWMRDRGFARFAGTGSDLPGDWSDRYRPERVVFGITDFSSWGSQSAHGWGCYAARDEACRKALGLDGETAATEWWRSTAYMREVPGWAFGRITSYGSAFGAIDRVVFQTLRSEFGDEAFGRFWSSDRPVGEAFEDAFGIDFVDWTKSWLQVAEQPLEAGPGMPWTDVLLSLLVMGVLLGTGGLIGKARSV